MKRKFLLLILTVLCAAACCFAFSACGIFGDNSGGTPPPAGDGGDSGSGADDSGENDGSGGDNSGSGSQGGGAAHSHSYSVSSVSATCTEYGYYIFTCSCGYSYTEQNPSSKPLGHSTVSHEAKPATCGEAGYEAYEECRRCDYTTYKAVPALGHNLKDVPARQADCAHTGWEAYTECSRCGYSTKVEISKTEHKTLVPKSGGIFCDTVCKDCGEVVDTAEHVFSGGKCSVCGLERNGYLDAFNGTYGYEYLATMAKGASMRKLYTAMDLQARAFHENGQNAGDGGKLGGINFQSLGLTSSEALAVWQTFRNDNPLYYWLSGTLTYTNSEIFMTVYDAYVSGSVRNKMNKTVYAKAEEWAQAASAEKTDYMRALAFHDMIIEAVDYAYDPGGSPESSGWAHNICGVIEGRGAVCEGYAKTFQLLLNVSGVNNIFVTGRGGNEAHAWNMVELNGEWYWYDVTWDDTPSALWGVSYGYCAVADNSFLQTHTADGASLSAKSFLYGLPARANSDYSGNDAGFKTTFTLGGLEYTVVGYNAVMLSSIGFDGGALTIPQAVSFGNREYAVVSIGSYSENGSVEGCDIGLTLNITSVYIPATVKFIGYNTFYAVRALREINVDNNNPAYSSSDGVLFTKSRDVLIIFPNAHRATSYTIPEETSMIAYHAFGTGVENGRNLESLTIGKNVRGVGMVDFGYGYRNIIGGAWGDISKSITGKKELIIDGNNPYYKVKDGMIFNSGYTYLYACLPATEVAVIPQTVTEMDTGAFNRNRTVKRVELPEGYTAIKDHMFLYCSSLESVYIPGGITEIGDSAFFGCGSLKSVNIPQSVKTIKRLAFYNCVSLNEITIPDGVESIGVSAFESCFNLLSVTLGAGVTEIGADAFKNCVKLLEVYNLSAIEITAGSTGNGYIGYYAKDIYGSADAESKYARTDGGFIFYKNQDVCCLMGYVGDLTEIALPDGYGGGGYDIYAYAFYNTKIEKLTVAGCVGIIGQHAFYGGSLKEVVLLSGVKTVDDGAFMYCSGLTSVTIPASVEKIAEYAFTGCGNLDVYYGGSQSDWDTINESGSFWETTPTIHCAED